MHLLRTHRAAAGREAWTPLLMCGRPTPAGHKEQLPRGRGHGHGPWWYPHGLLQDECVQCVETPAQLSRPSWQACNRNTVQLRPARSLSADLATTCGGAPFCSKNRIKLSKPPHLQPQHPQIQHHEGGEGENGAVVAFRLNRRLRWGGREEKQGGKPWAWSIGAGRRAPPTVHERWQAGWVMALRTDRWAACNMWRRLCRAPAPASSPFRQQWWPSAACRTLSFSRTACATASSSCRCMLLRIAAVQAPVVESAKHEAAAVAAVTPRSGGRLAAAGGDATAESARVWCAGAGSALC